MYLTKTPFWLKALYPKLTWNKSRKEKKVFISFDDGPCPEITDWVLDQLENHQAKASFFLIGNNAEANPEILKRIISKGHSIGNHTQNHMNGWRNHSKAYIKEVDQCASSVDSKLFRPPYGRIKKAQARALISKGYEIIMWDVLSGDFDTNLSSEDCVKTVLKGVENGSIIVFHDSQKAWPRLKESLPKVLEYLQENHYSMEAL